MWSYSQSSGKLYDASGELIGTGYSGHGAGLNAPSHEADVALGPIPRGPYSASWEDYHPHLGPVVAALSPVGHAAHGRSGFFMHGDNADMNHTASDGCIIMNRLVRLAWRSSGDTHLLVKE